jgi:hypothetical protein
MYGARGETRTRTVVISEPRDFKSLVSTIPPPGHVTIEKKVSTHEEILSNEKPIITEYYSDYFFIWMCA